MRKLLFIIYLLFLSCDSSEIFGVHEIDDTTLDYYDYIARGWQAVFDDDFDLAFSDFTEAAALDSVEYKNSAYVGLGWTSTFYANSFFNSSECLASVDVPCDDVVDGLRFNADNYFELASIDVALAEAEYETDNLANDGLYINTFQEFDVDRQIGEIYLSLLEFDMTDFDLYNGADIDTDGIVDDFSSLTNIKNQLEQFLLNNDVDGDGLCDYDIANNKPSYTSTYNFNYQNLYSLLSQLLLRLGQVCDAHSYVVNLCDLNVCSDSLYSNEEECIANGETWDETCNGDEELLFECLQTIFD